MAIINDADSKKITEVLTKIPLEKRNLVREVTLDVARNMGHAATLSCPKAQQVIDRFLVVRLVMDVMQHLRVKYRWEVIEQENKAVKDAKAKGKKYSPEILSNGDTMKKLLARSRYLFYKLKTKWTANQTKRAAILLKNFGSA